MLWPSPIGHTGDQKANPSYLHSGRYDCISMICTYILLGSMHVYHAEVFMYACFEGLIGTLTLRVRAGLACRAGLPSLVTPKSI
jgi:hypothetical protein